MPSVLAERRILGWSLSAWTIVLWGYALTILVFLLAPSFYIVAISLDASGLGLWPTSPTFEWYGEIASNAALVDAAKTSLVLALATTILSLVLGLLAARAFRLVRVRSLLVLVMLLPVFLPGILVGFDLMVYFRVIGIANTFWAALVTHTLWALPFAFVFLLTTMSAFDPTLNEASSDLGGNNLQTFLLIELPLIRPGVIGAAVLSFTLSLNEFIRTFFIQGLNSTLPTYIFGFIRSGIEPTIFAVSGLITLVSLALLVLVLILGAMSVRRERTTAVSH